MVLVNYTSITEEGESPEWLVFLLGTIQGRAAPIFVVLAGVGVSLLTRRARLEQDPALFREARLTLLKRAIFLLLLGAVLITKWRPDILHYYALYLTAALFFLRAPPRVLLGTAVLAIAAFFLLYVVFDYDAGWSEAGRYAGFWTVRGTFRRVFFDGYYPFFPWLAFILIGMWLGRQNLSADRFLNRTLWISLASAVCLQLASWYLSGLSSFVEIESDSDPSAIWSTDPYPPGPFYMATSTGFALALIVLSLKFAAAWPENWPAKVLVPTGQLALTIYVAHATLGFAVLSYLGEEYEESSTLAAATAVGFCLAAMVLAVLWRLRFERGPIELVMRKVTGAS